MLLELDGEPVGVRHGALLATTFHPELTDDRRIHQYFVDQCVRAAAIAATRCTPDDVGVA